MIKTITSRMSRHYLILGGVLSFLLFGNAWAVGTCTLTVDKGTVAPGESVDITITPSDPNDTYDWINYDDGTANDTSVSTDSGMTTYTYTYTNTGTYFPLFQIRDEINTDEVTTCSTFVAVGTGGATCNLTNLGTPSQELYEYFSGSYNGLTESVDIVQDGRVIKFSATNIVTIDTANGDQTSLGVPATWGYGNPYYDADAYIFDGELYVVDFNGDFDISRRDELSSSFVSAGNIPRVEDTEKVYNLTEDDGSLYLVVGSNSQTTLYVYKYNAGLNTWSSYGSYGGNGLTFGRGSIYQDKLYIANVFLGNEIRRSVFNLNGGAGMTLFTQTNTILNSAVDAAADINDNGDELFAYRVGSPGGGSSRTILAIPDGFNLSTIFQGATPSGGTNIVQYKNTTAGYYLYDTWSGPYPNATQKYIVLGWPCVVGATCGTAHGNTYYTATKQAPLTAYPSMTYCSDGSTPVINETNGLFTWNCPSQTGCSAMNYYCQDSTYQVPAPVANNHETWRADDEECDSVDDCQVSCVCDNGYEPDDNGACILTPVCGDGSETGAEECDDGNTVSGDGCSATCLSEVCSYVGGSVGGVLEQINFFSLGKKTTVGDVDGDVVNDVIIGAVGEATSNPPFIAAFMIYKAVSPYVKDVLQVEDNGFGTLIAGDQTWLGSTVQSMLDLYNDSVPDVALSAYYDESATAHGSARVVFDYTQRTCTLP